MQTRKVQIPGPSGHLLDIYWVPILCKPYTRHWASLEESSLLGVVL